MTAPNVKFTNIRQKEGLRDIEVDGRKVGEVQGSQGSYMAYLLVDRATWFMAGVAHTIPDMRKVVAQSLRDVELRKRCGLDAVADGLDMFALEKARRAVEDELIDRRDRRMAILGRGNGLVVREPDGSLSDIMRLTTDEALEIGIKVYLAETGAPRG